MSMINTKIPTVSSTPPKGGSAPVASKTVSKTTTTKSKNLEGMAVRRYRKMKQRVKYYELKKALLGNLTKGEEFLYQRFKLRLRKARKMAAPELIQQNLKKRAARGHGKKRGSDLSKLMTGKLK